MGKNLSPGEKKEFKSHKRRKSMQEDLTVTKKTVLLIK